ncbi:MAG: ATP-grasp domain-containing protein [Bacteroidia bacterium]|nr:ATP-grasp domain-containing protein [Bacteroidia bacterium]
MSPQTILITGARAPVALELARSFYAQGHRVIMADAIRLPIARWSGSVDTYYVVPAPEYTPEAFARRLAAIVQAEKVDHVIPTCEEAIYLAALRDHLGCKVWTVDQALILQLHHKYQFTRLAHPTLTCPETVLLRAFTDWEHSDQYVYKPVYSRFASSVMIRQRLSSAFFGEEDQDRWVVQRYISGQEICVYSVWDAGRLKAYAAYRPRFRAGKGAGIFFEPVHHEEVFRQVSTFGREIRYTGQLCFDVIVDETQHPYFLECNPRGTSGAHLLNQRLASAFLDEEGMLQGDNQSFAIKYAMALLHPAACLTRQVRQAKDPVWSGQDPKPFFFQLLSLLEITWIKFSRGITWLEATTAGITWNEDKPTDKVSGDTPRV